MTILSQILSLGDNYTGEIPILHSIAVLWSISRENRGSTVNIKPGLIEKRIDRHYKRLCRVQEELENLNARKNAAKNDTSFKDFAFSNTDFTPYKKMPIKQYEMLIPEALGDFKEEFLRGNFGMGRKDLHIFLENKYVKQDDHYILKEDNPLVISIMRSLDTSLDNADLFSFGEIESELSLLSSFIEVPETKELFPLLVSCLDKLTISHSDGQKTKLFIQSPDELRAVFMPGSKAWTRVLIPSFS